MAQRDASLPEGTAPLLLQSEIGSSNRSLTASHPSPNVNATFPDCEDGKALCSPGWAPEAAPNPHLFTKNSQPHFKAHTRIDADRPTSTFLQLAPELRNHICKYVLTTPDSTIEVGRKYCNDSKTWVRASQALAFTETCKQIHDEYSALPYQLNANLKIFVDKLERLRQLAASVLARKDDCNLQNVTFVFGEFGRHTADGKLNAGGLALSRLQPLRDVQKSSLALHISFTLLVEEPQRRVEPLRMEVPIKLCDPQSVIESIRAFHTKYSHEVLSQESRDLLASIERQLLRLFWPGWFVRNRV